jgi:hypothetical protein
LGGKFAKGAGEFVFRDGAASAALAGIVML